MGHAAHASWKRVPHGRVGASWHRLGTAGGQLAPAGTVQGARGAVRGQLDGAEEPVVRPMRWAAWRGERAARPFWPLCGPRD